VPHSSTMDPEGEDRLPWSDYDDIGAAGVSSRLTERMAAAVDALHAVYGTALSVGNYEDRHDRRPGVLKAATQVCVELERMLDIIPPPGSKRWG